MGTGSRGRWGAAILAALCGLAPLRAADLIEPWPVGWSDLELFTAFEPGSGPHGATTLGFGLGGGLSFGLSLASGDHPGELGLLLVWSRDLGGGGEIDLIVGADSVDREVELARLERSFGIEWSAPRAAGALRPYARLTVSRADGATHLHPMLGCNVGLGRVDLHLELSAEQPAPGERWPVHLAIGPNLALTDGFELVPELSLLYDREAAELRPTLSVGIVTSPAALTVAWAGFLEARR